MKSQARSVSRIGLRSRNILGLRLWPALLIQFRFQLELVPSYLATLLLRRLVNRFPFPYPRCMRSSLLADLADGGESLSHRRRCLCIRLKSTIPFRGVL